MATDPERGQIRRLMKHLQEKEGVDVATAFRRVRKENPHLFTAMMTRAGMPRNHHAFASLLAK